MGWRYVLMQEVCPQEAKVYPLCFCSLGKLEYYSILFDLNIVAICSQVDNNGIDCNYEMSTIFLQILPESAEDDVINLGRYQVFDHAQAMLVDNSFWSAYPVYTRCIIHFVRFAPVSDGKRKHSVWILRDGARELLFYVVYKR